MLHVTVVDDNVPIVILESSSMILWIVTRIVSVLRSLQFVVKLESQILQNLPSFHIFGIIVGVGFIIHGKIGSGVFTARLD